jgi:hypothetical protein
MAFVAEVKARLGLDTTDFQRALTKTQADVARIGKDTERKLARSFGGDDAIKGLLQGAGIGTLEAVVSKLTQGFREAAESAKNIAESTAKTLGIYTKIFAGRRSDEQNLAENRKRQERLQRDLADAKRTESRSTGSAFNPFTGKTESTSIVTKSADMVKAAEIAEQLSELAAEEVALRDKIAKTKESQAELDRKAVAEEMKSQAELDSLIKENARAVMDTDEQIADLAEERSRVEAVVEQERTMNGREDLERKKEIERLNGKILALEKKRADEAERGAKAEKDKAAQIAKAQQAVADAAKKADDAFADRSSVSLEDAAAGKFGTTQNRRAAAQRILRLEANARRQRVTGFESEAFESTSRALKLRGQLGFAPETERDPLAGSADAIKKSEQHLAELVASLKAEKIR